MNNMNTGFELAAEPNHQLNCFILGRARTSSEKRLIVLRRVIIVCQSLRFMTNSSLNGPGQFGMHNQQGGESREFRHRLAQVFFGDVLEFVYARGNQEAFETYYSRVT